jgi:hypothetical protein
MPKCSDEALAALHDKIKHLERKTKKHKRALKKHKRQIKDLDSRNASWIASTQKQSQGVQTLGQEATHTPLAVAEGAAPQRAAPSLPATVPAAAGLPNAAVAADAANATANRSAPTPIRVAMDATAPRAVPSDANASEVAASQSGTAPTTNTASTSNTASVTATSKSTRTSSSSAPKRTSTPPPKIPEVFILPENDRFDDPTTRAHDAHCAFRCLFDEQRAMCSDALFALGTLHNINPVDDADERGTLSQQLKDQIKRVSAFRDLSRPGSTWDQRFEAVQDLHKLASLARMTAQVERRAFAKVICFNVENGKRAAYIDIEYHADLAKEAVGELEEAATAAEAAAVGLADAAVAIAAAERAARR